MIGMVLKPADTATHIWTTSIFACGYALKFTGTVIDFDHIIRFLGYRQDSNHITPDKHDITLCWEVLQTTNKPAAFSLKFVHDGQILADRTSIHGLGHFNSVSWQPGDRFCDRFDIFIDDPDVPDDPPPIPGQVYDMLVTVLNAKTLEADWQATSVDGQPIKFPFVGQVVSPAGDMSAGSGDAWQPSDIAVPNFAHLLGIRLAKHLIREKRFNWICCGRLTKTHRIHGHNSFISPGRTAANQSVTASHAVATIRRGRGQPVRK